MSNGPKTMEYKGVEIRYGYAITMDAYLAHFTLPEKRAKSSFQTEVRRDMAPPQRAGKQEPVKGDSPEAVVAGAKSIIDAWLAS